MKCPNCNNIDSKVLETRANDDDFSIRRRRECTACGRRFTTHETIEIAPVLVVKSNGNRVAFDEQKIWLGIIKACDKRSVSAAQIEALVSEISKQIAGTMQSEISTKQIGEMVMKGLKDIDEVAYIRFASVYRQFKDMTTFKQEIEKLLNENKD